MTVPNVGGQFKPFVTLLVEGETFDKDKGISIGQSHYLVVLPAIQRSLGIKVELIASPTEVTRYEATVTHAERDSAVILRELGITAEELKLRNLMAGTNALQPQIGIIAEGEERKTSGERVQTSRYIVMLPTISRSLGLSVRLTTRGWFGPTRRERCEAWVTSVTREPDTIMREMYRERS